MRPEVAHRRQDILGESPVWSVRDQALWWVDIHRQAIIRDGVQEWAMPSNVGSIGVRRAGGLVAALRHGFAVVEDGAPWMLAQPIAGTPDVRFNDGRVDRRGRFWAGTVQERRVPGAAGLWRLDPGGACLAMVEGITVSNALCWSADDRTMYLACSHARTVWAFDFDADAGVPSNRRVFVHVEHGVPDGATVDADGCVWLAQWDGARIVRYTPAGATDRVVLMPVPRPTSCAFGGPGLDTLFVTSARIGLDEATLAAAPLSGSVFALRPGIAGLAEPEFLG